MASWRACRPTRGRSTARGSFSSICNDPLRVRPFPCRASMHGCVAVPILARRHFWHFRCCIPTPGLSSSRLAEARRSEMTSKLNGPRVLLVDDYRDARDMYGEYLEYSGYQVIQAANGIEALQRAIDDQPDIILMDLSLPVMDGWEATRRLKADQRTASIPVVALTGHALAGISEGAKKAGCDAFVTKPCLPEDLVKEIRKVLDAQSTASKKPRRSGKYAKSIG